MPLTEQEAARLAELEAKYGSTPTPVSSGGLTPQEQARFDELDAKFSKQDRQGMEMPLGEALIQNTPLAPGIRDLAKGQYTKDQGAADIAGRVTGDMATGIGLAAPFVAGGASAFPPVAGGIALGAGLGALFEKTGASPALRHEASVIRDRAPKVPAFISGEKQPRKAWEFAKSIGAQVPNEAGATALELAPSVMSSLGTGLGLKGAAALKARPQMGKAPGAAGLLQEHGGRVTPAMVQQATKGQRVGMAPAIENVSRANPLTSGMLERTDKANIGAIEKFSKERIPQGFNTGERLADTMEQFQTRRGQKVSAAKDAVRDLGTTTLDKAPGKAASKTIVQIMQDGGVPFDESGKFRPDQMTGKERIGKVSAEVLAQVADDIKDAQIGESVNYLQNFDENYAPQLKDKYGSASTKVIKEVRAVLKEAITKAAEGKSAPVAAEYRAANELYSKTQPFVKSLLKKSRGETSNAALFETFFGKSAKHADKSLKAFSEGMVPEEFGKIQDTMAAGIIENATDANGVLSLPKLKTSLKTMGENTKYLKPEVQEGFQNMIQMMEAAGVSELGQPNPSGTGSRTLANTLTGGIGGAGVGALLGHPGPLAGAAAGSGAAALYLKSPQIKAALGKGIKNIPNIPAGQGAAVAGLGASNTENQRKAAERAKRLARGK